MIVEGRVSFRNINHCTKPSLTIFCTQKMGLIIADSCFNSHVIDYENKVTDLSEYFLTQNTSIEYWAMFEKGEKGLFGGNFYFRVETIGNIRWFWLANRTEYWKRSGLSLI